MRTVTRRCWKAAAAVVLTAGGYALLAPEPSATAQPAPQWMRSSSPLSPAAASSTPLPPAPGAVIPASAILPATAQPPVPPLPVLPSTPPVPPPAAPMQLDFKAPVAPKQTAPMPVAPVLPLAPPAPPAKSAPPAQPTTPSKVDSPLRPTDVGNSVKTDAAWKAAPAQAPTPREVSRVVDRPKPQQGPVAPSERDVFVLPKPPAPAVPLPAPAPVAGPVVPPPLTVPPPEPAPIAGPVAPPVVPPPTIVPVPPPAVPAVPVATTPGANPMTFKSAAAAAVLGGALLAPQPAAAQDNPKDKDAAKTTDQKLEAIQKSLARLTELLDGRKDETGTVLPSDPGVVKQLKDLRDEVASLKSQFETLKSTSLRPPAGAGPSIPGVPNPMPGSNPPAAPAQQGTVRVVNEYPIEITMVVNGRTFRVAPNASQDIPVAVGNFSYQLLSANTAAAPTNSTIRAGEVVTLRIK